MGRSSKYPATPPGKVCLEITPVMEAELRRRGVFPDLRREAADYIRAAAFGVHFLTVKRAREIYAYATAQRVNPENIGSIKRSYSALEQNVGAWLRPPPIRCRPSRQWSWWSLVL